MTAFPMSASVAFTCDINYVVMLKSSLITIANTAHNDYLHTIFDRIHVFAFLDI